MDGIPDRHVTRIDGHVTLQLLTLVNYKYSRTFNRGIHSWTRPTIFCVFLPSSICNVKNIFINCTGYLYLLRLLSGGHCTCQPWWRFFDSPFRDQVLPRNDNYAMSKLPHCYRYRERRFRVVEFARRIDRSRLRSRYLKDSPILEDSSREPRAQTRRRR